MDRFPALLCVVDNDGMVPTSYNHWLCCVCVCLVCVCVCVCLVCVCVCVCVCVELLIGAVSLVDTMIYVQSHHHREVGLLLLFSSQTINRSFFIPHHADAVQLLVHEGLLHIFPNFVCTPTNTRRGKK